MSGKIVAHDKATLRKMAAAGDEPAKIALGIPLSRPRPVKKTYTDLWRVACPYCHIGGGNATVIHHASGETQVNKEDLVTCDACGHPFRIRPSLTLVGEGLDAHLHRAGDPLLTPKTRQ